MTEAEIRSTERKACAEELESLAKAHLACAIEEKPDSEMQKLYTEKAKTVWYCAKRLLAWGEERQCPR